MNLGIPGHYGAGDKTSLWPPSTQFYMLFYIFNVPCEVLAPLNLPGYLCPTPSTPGKNIVHF